MQTPDIAVVIPVRLRAPHEAEDLRRCLQALAACQPAPTEVFVVDDGSDEAVLLPADFPRGTRLLRQDNQGPGLARNAGFAASSAPLVAFVDADVTVPADALGRLAAHFDDPAVAASWATVSPHHPHGGFVSRYKLHSHRHFTLQLGAGPGPWPTPHLTTMLAMVRRQPFVAIGGFAASWDSVSVEDVELGRDLVEAGGKVLLDPTVEVGHGHRFTLRSAMRNDAHKLRRLVRATLHRRASGGREQAPDGPSARRMRAYAASVPLGVGAVAAAGLGAWPGAALLLLALGLAERDQLRYLYENEGAAFAFGCLPLMAIERCTATAATLAGVVDHLRGDRKAMRRTGPAGRG